MSKVAKAKEVAEIVGDKFVSAMLDSYQTKFAHADDGASNALLMKYERILKCVVFEAALEAEGLK